VDAEKLRFDFSFGKPVPPEALAAIEAAVQAVVDANVPVFAKEVALAPAKQINGLRAVFGEVRTAPATECELS
jgi:alanyl-tRNA synthetase